MSSRGCFVVVLVACAAACANPNVTGSAVHYDLAMSGVALDGYDPVAYLTDHRAVEGKPEFSHVVQGAIYYFSSEAHRDLFAANPNIYRPAWGGWCAWAVSHQGTFGADPESFVVKNGRVFLFHDSIFFDAKAAWLKQDDDSLASAGDAYWKQLSGE